MDFVVAALQVPRALAAAALGLGVFSFLFAALTKLTGVLGDLPVVGGVAKIPLALLVDSLGPASKFIPSSTHFFLAAVVAATVLPAPKVKVPALPAPIAGLLGTKRTPSRRR